MSATGVSSSSPIHEKPLFDRKKKLVYVGVAGDIIHHGHINILNAARKLGKVTVGLLTDEAIESYKRKPIIPWEKRKILMEAFVDVEEVIPQTTLSYIPNLKMLKPDHVVHGDDWKAGKQRKTRQGVIDTVESWGGSLVEPGYTPDISTTDIINRFHAIEEKEGQRLSIDKTSQEVKVEEAGQEDAPSAKPQTEPTTTDTAASTEVSKRDVPLVYVAISSDFFHHGHINVIQEARKLGDVILGVLTDEACSEYRATPVLPLATRLCLARHLKDVSRVVEQRTLDYAEVLEELKPDFVVHGDNWKTGEQQETRAQVVETLTAWGGKLIEPAYSTDITEIALKIQQRCHEEVLKKKNAKATKAAAAGAAALK